MINNQKEEISRLLHNQYIIEHVLGEGAFGIIYYAKNKNNQQVALKCTNIQKIIGKERNPQAKEFKRQLLESQAKIMQNLTKSNNKNIVKCYSVVKNQKYQILVLEYCNKGSLFDKIQLQGKIQENQAINILAQLLNGFAGMHKQKVIHRDIKAQNILIHNNTYKLADFGLSKNVNQLTKYERGTILGTRCTIAPEVIKSQEYSSQADIWSIGVVFYEMLTGKLPFNNIINDQQVLKLHNDLKDLDISQQSKNLFRQLFVINPNRRLQWKQFYKMLIDQAGIFHKNRSSIKQNHQKRYPTEIALTKDFSKQNISTRISYSQNPFSNQLFKVHLSKQQFQQYQKKIIFNFDKTNLIKQKIINHLYDFNFNKYKFVGELRDQNTQSKLLFLLFIQCIHLLEQFADFVCINKGKAGKYSSLKNVNSTINNLNKQLQNLYSLNQRFTKFNHKPQQQLLTKYAQYQCSTSQHIQKIHQYSRKLFKKQSSFWSCIQNCFSNKSVNSDIENFIFHGYKTVVQAQNSKSFQWIRRG